MNQIVDQLTQLQLAPSVWEAHGFKPYPDNGVLAANIRGKLGPMRALVSNDLVLSGSFVLDVLDDTNFAGDKDLFGTTAACSEAALDLMTRGFSVKKEFNPSYGPGTDPYRYVATYEGFKVDVINCQNTSVPEVIVGFDLSRNRIAFDGQRVWIHESWRPEKVSVVFYTKQEMDQQHVSVSTGPASRALLRSLCRVNKYIQRGYTIYDRNGVQVGPFD